MRRRLARLPSRKASTRPAERVAISGVWWGMRRLLARREHPGRSGVRIAAEDGSKGVHGAWPVANAAAAACVRLPVG
ncbi:hypothetical protein TUM18999_60900 [Pseudomonas tohonis]|uniref:Uncharacterized protein n=1 Tax=Pseudomonas tohonis TaxID=2725477 RepID=A0A6J4EEX0_9PSED|nr:hypothetical protein TUM18999_60900 [Pseudomonas tohonis]GJN52502.1 hypothetical protein TUM20286_22540 [Pseudomonas tohonis]